MKTVIVTGASQGIGAAVVKTFLDRGYNVVATSRNASRSPFLPESKRLVVVDGDVREPSSAEQVTAAALNAFGSVDALVNNAGIFFSKPFTDYSIADFRALVATNLEGFLFMTQASVRQMLTQHSSGSVVTITASLAGHAIDGLPASIPMMTKGGLNAVTRSLAMEYARNGIRVNAVAPGAVDTPLVRDAAKDFLRGLSPMNRIGSAEEIADAVFYLTDAAQVTGEVLHVDGGAHVGKW